LATVADWLETNEFTAEAIAHYEEALQDNPDKDWSLRVAALHHAVGDEDAALAAWQGTLERDNVPARTSPKSRRSSNRSVTRGSAAIVGKRTRSRAGQSGNPFALAKNLSRADQHQEALPHYEALSKIEDNDYFAERGERGMLDCYAALEMLADKLEEWEDQADANPDSAPVLARLGRLQERAGATDKALILYERCAELEPANTDHLRTLAYAYRRTREIDRAIETFNQLIAAEPNRAGGYYREVLDLYLQADFKDDAIATARKIVEIAPGDPESRLDLAQVYQTYSMHDEALAQFRHALRLEPGEPQYHRVYGQALAAQEHWGEAREAYRNMLATSVEDATRLAAVRELTAIYQQQDQLDELVREFQRRVRNTPKKLAAYEELAAIYYESGDNNRAIGQLEEALAAVDDKAPALKSLVRAAYETQHFDKVVTHYEALIELTGRASAFEYERLGTVYAQLGDLEKAIETWNLMTEAEPDNPRSWATLARVLSREGFQEDALAARAKALELAPGNHRLRIEYAQQLAGAEQPEEAIEQYARILELGESADTEEEESKEKQVNRRARGYSNRNNAYAWRGASNAFSAYSYRNSQRYRDMRREVIVNMTSVANNSIGVDELIERMAERVENNPASLEAKFDLLMLYQAASYGPQTVEHLEAMLEEYPDNIELLEEASTIYSWQQDVDKSIATLDRLAELQPRQRGAHLIARLNLQMRNDDTEAVDALAGELIEDYGDDPACIPTDYLFVPKPRPRRPDGGHDSRTRPFRRSLGPAERASQPCADSWIRQRT
jgi:tetratricopeptide (TPR) repeat protein